MASRIRSQFYLGLWLFLLVRLYGQDMIPILAHLDGFNLKPASLSLPNTVPRSSKLFPSTIISSKYTRYLDHCTPANSKSINFWKVAGALHKPKGITLNSYRPWYVVNAVFCLSCSDTSTCQYPLIKSSVENHWDPDRVSKVNCC